MKISTLAILTIITLTTQHTYSINCSGFQITQCLVCETGVNQCATCSEGYYPPLCQACPENCSTCSDENSCTSCKKGYFTSSIGGNDLCIACSAGCEDCVDSTTCRECGDGYYFNQETAVCTQCDVNCQTCSSGIVCDTCKTGYFMDFSDPSGCLKCVDENCERCEEYDKCQSCADGYYIYNDVCWDINADGKILVIGLGWGLVASFLLSYLI